MGTARDLITRSFRLLGTHAQGETPTAAEINDGLTTLKEMLDTWSADGRKVYYRVKDELVLTPGQSSYTFGTGGNLNSARPARIISANIRSAAGQEYMLEIIDSKQWANIPLKSTQGDIPLLLYSEDTYPLDTLNLYYVPSVANTLVIYSEKAFADLTLNSSISFPPGYAKALRYGLAIDLAPEYGLQVSQEVLRGYTEAMTLIERRNTQDQLMNGDPFMSNTEFNINSGSFD